MTACRVIVFVKAPRPGWVKTRLAADLDPEAAAAIHRVLVGRTVARLGRLPDVELRFAPDDAGAEIKPWLRPGWRLAGQGTGDLGERLERATSAALTEGSRGAVVIGTDCPALEPEDLDEATAGLEQHDVVLGPAEDGGYWLIGLRAPQPALFRGIPWSTAEVFERTCDRARDAGLSMRSLRRLRDVDTLHDWRAWLREGDA